MFKPAPSALTSTLFRRCARSLQLFATMLLLTGSGTVAAESLTTVTSGSLPALPEPVTVAGLVPIEGRMVAFSKDNAWVLGADTTTWQPLARQAADKGGVLQGNMSVAGRTYLLEGQDASTSTLQSVRLHNGALVVGEAIALPVALRAAHAAAFNDAP